MEENIINILGIQSLPAEEKAAMVAQMTDLIEKRLLIRILDSLSPEKKTEYEQLLDKEDGEAANKFLQDNVPTMGDWLMEEIGSLKQELAQRAEQLDQEA